MSSASTFTPDDNRRTLRAATSRAHTLLLIVALVVAPSLMVGFVALLAFVGFWALALIPVSLLICLAISVANAMLHGLDVLADMSALAQLEAARHSRTVGPPVTPPAPVASPSRSP